MYKFSFQIIWLMQLPIFWATRSKYRDCWLHPLPDRHYQQSYPQNWWIVHAALRKPAAARCGKAALTGRSSAESRVGKEGVSKGQYRCVPGHVNKNKRKTDTN